MRTIRLYPIIVFFLSLGVSCVDFDHYSTNVNYQLTFSSDTIHFDTIFTTVGSTTAKLMVYNNNPQPLKIESVRLLLGDEKGFHINVDGAKGNNISNIIIKERDSLYIFIQANIQENQENKPYRINDLLIFTVNGKEKQVVLQAYGQNAYHWKGKRIESDTIIQSDKPIIIHDSLIITDRATLTVNEGVVFYMANKAHIEVHGKLNTLGSINKPVVIRGVRLDKLLSNLPYDLSPGQWGGITIHNSSSENSLVNTIIRNPSYGLIVYGNEEKKRSLYMYNCQLTNSSGDLIVSYDSWIDAINTELTNARGKTTYLVGGKYLFTHCTFANYFRFASPEHPVLILTNYLESPVQTIIPITQANFNNCIIDGKIGNELRIMDASSDKGIASILEYRFDHCLIRTKQIESPRFIETIWDQQADFINTADKGYQFDFRIDSNSKARQSGNKIYSLEYPLDRYGVARSSDERPDIGAYQWVE